jgi:hypothetical protein
MARGRSRGFGQLLPSGRRLTKVDYFCGQIGLLATPTMKFERDTFVFLRFPILRVLAGTAPPNGSIARPFARVPWPTYSGCNLGQILRDPSRFRPLTDLPHHTMHRNDKAIRNIERVDRR